MNFVHVPSDTPASAIDFNPAIMGQNKLCLRSIIGGLRQQDFNTHTLNKTLAAIKSFSESYVRPCGGELLVDSGGYSIIKGEVHPTAIPRFVQCYNTLLRLDACSFDKVFSLDIPWNTRFPEMNTKSRIFDLNDYSIATAREILLDDPDVLDRYSFVWHFKMQDQYEIWKHLYDKHDLNKYIRHRAIGGMVALRDITGISFSPFIGIAYRCLLDYIESQRYDSPFSLHFLGMYLPYDRFTMAVLDVLFSWYLEGDVAVFTSYDSISPLQAPRKSKDVPFFQFQGNQLLALNNLVDAPATTLEMVYTDPTMIQFVREEIERRRNGERLLDANTFAPLSVFSHREVDRYFEHVVNKHGLAEVFFQKWSLTQVNAHFERALVCLGIECPALFTKHLKESIMRNVAITYEFHRWFVDDRSRDGLEERVAVNIRKIRFPGSLS